MEKLNKRNHTLLLFIIVSVFALSLQMCARNNTTDTNDASSITYRVAITGHWMTGSHPNGPTAGALPGGAHFTSVATIVHNNMVDFWQVGSPATQGIENVAELGSTSVLGEEARSQGANILPPYLTFSAPGLTSSSTFRLNLQPTHSHVTMISMIAPSPDWFIGISSLNLRDTENKWYRCVQGDLFGYDAGTESATVFSLGGTPTNPQEMIHRLSEDEELMNAGFSLAERFASIRIELNSSLTSAQISSSTPMGNCRALR